MNILSLNPGHDGSIACIENAELKFSYEAEKDSFPRYSDLNASSLLDAFSYLSDVPDVIALSGYVKYLNSVTLPLGGGYFGIEPAKIITKKEQYFGRTINYFSSSHERSHILCSYGLSHFPQGKPCYVLVWEGLIGRFYEINEKLEILPLGDILNHPGIKYSFIYALANPEITSVRGRFRYSDAGKLMALTSFSLRKSYTEEEKTLANLIIHHDNIFSLDKNQLKNSCLYNIGVENPTFKNFSGNFSDSIFDVFYQFAKSKLTKKLPLLISGGCGLNCDWNTKWKDSCLFSDVFVPPVTNDSGSAIGTAIDALFYYTGKAKIDWNVYLGKPFIEEEVVLESMDAFDLDYQHVAQKLSEGYVIGWVQGRAEIGPRALGNRSILAAPFKNDMRDRLNKIKNRESYRPIAPICLETDVETYFNWQGSSPFMLYFQKLNTEALQGITHVDQTARIQTINHEQNKEIHNLLTQFKKITGYGVLCNTSLNFNGMGFINRTTDLFAYATKHDLDGFVINSKFYLKRDVSL